MLSFFNHQYLKVNYTKLKLTNFTENVKMFSRLLFRHTSYVVSPDVRHARVCFNSSFFILIQKPTGKVLSQRGSTWYEETHPWICPSSIWNRVSFLSFCDLRHRKRTLKKLANEVGSRTSEIYFAFLPQ